MAPRNPTILSKEVPPVSKPRRQPSFSKKLFNLALQRQSHFTFWPSYSMLDDGHYEFEVQQDLSGIGWTCDSKSGERLFVLCRRADHLEREGLLYMLADNDLEAGVVVRAEARDGLRAVDVTRDLPHDSHRSHAYTALRVVGLLRYREYEDGGCDMHQLLCGNGLVCNDRVVRAADPAVLPDPAGMDAYDVHRAVQLAECDLLPADQRQRGSWRLGLLTQQIPADLAHLVICLGIGHRLLYCGQRSITGHSAVHILREVKPDQVVDGRIYVASRESQERILEGELVQVPLPAPLFFAGVAHNGYLFDTRSEERGALAPLDSIGATTQIAQANTRAPGTKVWEVCGWVTWGYRPRRCWSFTGWVPTIEAADGPLPAPAQEVAA